MVSIVYNSQKNGDAPRFLFDFADIDSHMVGDVQ